MFGRRPRRNSFGPSAPVRVLGKVDMNAEYKWYEAYKAAVLETDWTKMNDRIDLAKSSIKLRLNELPWIMAARPKNGKVSPTP